MKKIRHFRDKLTGEYISKRKWAANRGKKRYVRSWENYTKPIAPQAPRKVKDKRLLEIEEILGEEFESLAQAERALAKETEEREIATRLKYLKSKDNRGIRDIEVISLRGKVTSVRIGQRTYKQRASIIRLQPLIDAAQQLSQRINKRNR